MPTNDVIIIGAGPNGLVTASYLAKAGLRPLVLERRDTVGGIAVTEEITPGFRCSTIAHTTGPLLPHVLKDLRLERYGLEFINPEIQLTALNPNGPQLSIHNDPKATVKEIEQFSANDVAGYLDFEKSFAHIGKVLSPILSLTPPAIDKPSASEVWDFGKLVRSL